MSTEQPSPPADPKEAQPPSGQLPLEEHRRIWQSNDLLGDDPEALIVHRGQTYRLRCTKQGKLILYK